MKFLPIVLASIFCAFGLRAEASWSYVTWSVSDKPALSSDNLMTEEGVSLSFIGNENAWGHATLGDPEGVNNGSLDCNMTGGKKQSYTIGNNAVMEAVFPRSCDFTGIKIYTWNNSGRDGVGVASVSVKYDGASDFTVLDTVPSFSYAVAGVEDAGGGTLGNGSFGAYVFTLSDGGAVIAQDISALRINFGTMDNNGTFVDEIEVCGTMDAATSYTVKFYDMDGVSIVDEQTVAIGGDAVAPQAVAHEGYVFLGWLGTYENVQCNLEIYPKYITEDATVWTDEYWSKDDPPALSEDNLLRRPGAALVRSGTGWNEPAMTDVMCLTNGVLDAEIVGGIETSTTCVIGDGNALIATFPRPAAVRSLKFYIWSNNSYRDGIGVASISVKRRGETEFSALEAFTPFSIHVNTVQDTEYGAANLGDSSLCSYIYTVRRYNGHDLAKGVVSIKVLFGTMDHNGTHFDEFEICGSCNGGTTILVK